MSLLTESLLFILFGLAGFYIWAKYHFSYWRRKNIPHIQPNLIFGNFKEILTMKTCAAYHIADLYNHDIAKNEPFVGIYIFHKPGLLVREPELIKMFLVKDFQKFSDRYMGTDTENDVVGSNSLFMVKNPQWKEIRTKLTPFFSSGKIKQMFSLMDEVGTSLDEYLCALEVDPITKSCEKEIKSICNLYTTDVIASVAFGVHANSLKNPNGDFLRNGRRIFATNFTRIIELTTIFFLPQLVSIMRCKAFSSKTTKFLRDTINFVINERMQNGKVRHDLIDILVAFKKEAEAEPGKKHFATNNDALIAQAASFFTAGHETSSVAVSFALYELSKNPALQKRLREEIKAGLIKNNNKITYEMVTEMEYMHMVILEALRMYPPLPFLDRECTLSKNEEEFSLKPHSDFTIPRGMPIYIPIYSLQRDPKYFPNPDEFDPERFSPENKDKINPFIYMPFGAGPHRCIGERYSSIQSAIYLTNFLRNHYVEPCEKSHANMVFERRSTIVQPKGGIYCKIVRDPLIKA